MITVLAFNTACDPMEDIYDELDDEQIIVGDAVIELTDADYEALGVEYGFTSLDEVKSLLPPFLSDLYPVWGKDSSVLVEYKMADGLSNLEEVNEFANAESYYLSNDDYPGATENAVGFYPSQDPADYIPAILESTIADPVEGQITLALYNQYVGEVTTGLSDYYVADFNGSLDGFEVVNVAGTNEWEASSYGDDEYAKMSAYGNGQNEDWLISPEIDLSGQTNAGFQINQTAPFINGEWNLISVLVSTDYVTGGDQLDATWDTLTIDPMPSGDAYDYSYVLSDLVDLSAYNGEKIHIAFKYQATLTTAPTWQIDYALIKVPGVEGVTDSMGMYFIYTSEGQWVEAEGVYYLSTSDYDEMGTASGQPGRYNNFDSSIIPNDYIPTFLDNKYPYAQEEDLLIVMYKYYIGSTVVRGNAYQVTDGTWMGSTPDLQFGNDGSTWVPDNTIKYTLTTADYDFLGEEYGDPGYYDNFDVREGKENYVTVDEIKDDINLVLLNNFPGAADGQKFNVYYNVYSGANEVWNMKLVLVDGTYVFQE